MPADPLSRVLQDLRLVEASYCRTEMRAPWGIELRAESGATFHLIIEGGCWLSHGDEAPVELLAGDVVLLPHGSGHTLRDAPGSPAVPVQELPRERTGAGTFELHGGGRGARALLVCCGVSFEASSALHPLLRLMPDSLLVRRGALADPALGALLDIMGEEIRERRIGAATVMARLADIIVTRVVRSWAEQHDGSETGWLAAVRDPQIGRALAAFHHNPERDWPVEALAATAHLSRSQFTDRFTAVLGVPPARYVAEFRMQLAARWLAGKRLSIGEVALRLGYESEPAFSRAFKRIVGHPPSAARSAPEGDGHE